MFKLIPSDLMIIPEVRETSIPWYDRRCQEWIEHCERMFERWERAVMDDQCSRWILSN